MSQSPNRYTTTAILLHWLIAIGIFGLFFLGWYMTDLPKEAPKAASFDLFDWGLYTWQLAEPVSPRSFYFNLHKSLGLTLLALVIFRLVWRITHQPPALLDSLKDWEKKLAKAGHHILYLLMFAMPISGVMMAVFSKYGLKWFGISLIAGLDNDPLRKSFVEIHEFIGTLILVVVAIHVLGALKHAIIDKDGSMKRMSLKK